MRLSSISLGLLGLAAQQTLAACPYAAQMAARSGDDSSSSHALDARSMPESHLKVPKALGRRAEGKKGVFFM